MSDPINVTFPSRDRQDVTSSSPFFPQSLPAGQTSALPIPNRGSESLEYVNVRQSRLGTSAPRVLASSLQRGSGCSSMYGMLSHIAQADNSSCGDLYSLGSFGNTVSRLPQEMSHHLPPIQDLAEDLSTLEPNGAPTVSVDQGVGLLRGYSVPATRRSFSQDTGRNTRRRSVDTADGSEYHAPQVLVSDDRVTVTAYDTALIYNKIPNAEGEEPVLQLDSFRVNRGEVLRDVFFFFFRRRPPGGKEVYDKFLACLTALPRVGGLFGGPAVALAFFLCSRGHQQQQALAVAGVLVWMALWWLLEVVPVAVTALLPAILWPVYGVMSADAVAHCYCNDAMSLIFGTFVMSVAVQRWSLDKRLAILTVTSVGPRPRLLMLATMGLTTGLGCLMSNTATATMMMPLVVAMVAYDPYASPQELEEGAAQGLPAQPGGPEGGASQPLLQREDPVWTKTVTRADPAVACRYLKGMILATAYTCSISGFATLTGTGPNLTFSGLWFGMSGEQIGWFQWFVFGLPLSLALELCLFVIINVLYLRAPSSELAKAVNLEKLEEDRKALPPVRGAEVFVLLDYALCVTLWITRKISVGGFDGWGDHLPMVGNGTVALLCTMLLFVWPAEGVRPKEGGAAGTQGPRVMDWAAAKTIKWNTLILIAGGFALSAGVTASGLDRLIAKAFSPLERLPNDFTVLCTIALVVLITDWLVSSNVAVATLTLPILGSVAEDMGLHKLALMVPATVACSLSFCSPVATPPNAIAYSTGHLRVSEMVQTGAVVAAMAVLGTWAFSLSLGELVFDYTV